MEDRTAEENTKAAGLRYLKGDATNPGTPGPRILIHICNDLGLWGKGFVLAVSRRWPEPEEWYRRWSKGQMLEKKFGLGEIQIVPADRDTFVINMVAQHGIRYATDGTPPIRYDALEQCLDKVAKFAAASKYPVVMPRIGAGLSGGDWGRISTILEDKLCAQGIPATVYIL